MFVAKANERPQLGTRFVSVSSANTHPVNILRRPKLRDPTDLALHDSDEMMR